MTDLVTNCLTEHDTILLTRMAVIQNINANNEYSSDIRCSVLCLRCEDLRARHSDVPHVYLYTLQWAVPALLLPTGSPI